MDVVMLGFFRTDHEVGLYTGAYKIVTLCSVVPNLIFTSFLPYLLTMKEGRKIEWKRYAAMMTRVGFPLAISVGICAPTLIALVYGAEYAGAIVPLRILSWDILAVFVSITFAQPLLLMGKERKYFSIVLSSAVLNIALNFVFIPRYGILGAAFTTVCAEGLVAYRSWRALTKDTGIHCTAEMIEILKITSWALLGSYTLWFFLGWNTIFTGTAFLSIYGLLTYRRWSVGQKLLANTPRL
jgi:O-antigen/teichoic acid export membrane protein